VRDAMDWSEMREMHRKGMSIAQISRVSGCDRKTVSRYIGAESPPRYVRGPSKSVLDPFKDHIRARLAEYPLSAARLHREIKEMGYSGSLTTVKRFISPIKDASLVLAEVRFETKPGEQAQVDWIDLGRMPVGATVEHIYVFVMVLSWSRMRFIRMTTDCRTDTFIDCHLKAFEYFGGWTASILYDNTKNVVLKRALLSSESTFNPMYLDFARHHGITPRLCRPGIAGAKTKGKVERTIQYVERDFLLGSTFNDIQHANSQGMAWCDRVNGEVQSTTHEVPRERWPHEGLKPFGQIVPYVITYHLQRTADRECFVRYLNNFYSVPWRFAKRQCQLEIRDGILIVLCAGEEIARHEVVPGSNLHVKIPEHFAGLHKLKRDESRSAHEGRMAGQRPALMPMFSFQAPVQVERRDLSTYDAFMGGPE